LANSLARAKHLLEFGSVSKETLTQIITDLSAAKTLPEAADWLASFQEDPVSTINGFRHPSRLLKREEAIFVRRVVTFNKSPSTKASTPIPFIGQARAQAKSVESAESALRQAKLLYDQPDLQISEIKTIHDNLVKASDMGNIEAKILLAHIQSNPEAFLHYEHSKSITPQQLSEIFGEPLQAVYVLQEFSAKKSGYEHLAQRYFEDYFGSHDFPMLDLTQVMRDVAKDGKSAVLGLGSQVLKKRGYTIKGFR